MDEIIALTEINFKMVFTGIIVILVGVVSIVSLVEKISIIIKKPVKWLKNRDDDHELVIKTAEELKKLSKKHEEDTKQSIRHDEMIREDLERLTHIVIDTKIDDMRWEILDFTSALTSGRRYNKESFDHVISQHEKYEKILEENGLENGQVTASMEVVMDVYKEKIKNGF